MPAKQKNTLKWASIVLSVVGALFLALALIAVPRHFVLFSSQSTALHAVTPTSDTITLAPSLAPTVIRTFPVTSSPTYKPTNTAVPISSVLTYTVRADDTLFGIALQYGTTVIAIKSTNGLTSDNIFPGDVLTIPASTTVIATLPTPTSGNQTSHVVVSGETLISIAERYGTTVEAIQSANGLTSDAIQAGQDLIIPARGNTVKPTLLITSSLWSPSPLSGDFQKGYPLTIETARLTLHYQPNSFAAQDRESLIKMLETAQAHIEKLLQVRLDGRLDAYAVGSLFASPDTALRGRSFSAQRRFFFLYDGSGTPADRQYILTHEMTHLVTWNTMGQPASVMLHEGVAVYTGMELVKDEGFLPLSTFCAAYYQIGRLPGMTTSLSFQGHIRNLDTYYAAGCFVQFLVEKYGTSLFAKVYRTGDYNAIYGKSLSSLEKEWVTSIRSSSTPLSFDSNELAHGVTQIADAYDRLFTNFTGTATQMAAYRELDQARMALLQGHFNDTVTHLDVFERLLAK